MIDQPTLTTLAYIVGPPVWIWCSYVLYDDLTNETHLDRGPEYWSELDEFVWTE